MMFVGSQISRWVCRIIFVAAAWVPCLMGALYGIVALWGGWGWLFPSHTPSFYEVPDFREFLYVGIFAFSGYLLLSFLLGKGICKFFEKRQEWKIVLALAFLAFSIRLILPLLFWGDPEPWSDFAQAWGRAIGAELKSDYHRFNVPWMNFALLLKGLVAVVGGGKNAMIVIVAGAAFNALTASCLYLVVQDLSQNRKMGILASLLYALNPTSILYVMTGSSEHPGIAFFMLSSVFLCRAFRKCLPRRLLILWVCAGISAGLGSSVKTFFPVFGTAATSSFLLCLMCEDDEKGDRLIRLKSGIPPLLLFFIFQAITFSLVTKMSEKTFKIPLEGVSGTAHYLVTGLSREGEGQVGRSALSRRFVFLREAGLDSKAASQVVYKELHNEWRGRWGELPSFMFKKSIWAWQDDNRAFHYFKKKMKLGKIKQPFYKRKIFKIVSNVGPVVGQLWYVAMMLGGACSLYWFCLKVNSAMLRRASLFPLLLFGYFLLVLVGEAQSRYKCLIIPTMCAVVALGFPSGNIKPRSRG